MGLCDPWEGLGGLFLLFEEGEEGVGFFEEFFGLVEVAAAVGGGGLADFELGADSGAGFGVGFGETCGEGFDLVGDLGDARVGLGGGCFGFGRWGFCVFLFWGF